MGIKALIGPMVSQAITSNRRRDAQRRRFEAVRVRAGKPHEVLYFHQVDDPYSALMAGRLAGLVEQYGVVLTPHLVPPPPDWAAPERQKLTVYARRDAALLAPAYGLDYCDRTPPTVPELERARSILQSAIDAGRFTVAAPVVARAMCAGESLDAAEADFGSATPATVATALEAGDRLRERLGHYLGATLYHAGEWYWGVDRLGDLEVRLRALGCGTGGSAACLLAPRPQPRFLETVRAADASTPALEIFLSFRSPYTYLAMERVQALVSHYGVELRLRFVLPMVMRGLPVPAAKRNYILRDCKREAERLGIPFGSVCDPVGRPVERGLAILNGAIPTGAGPAFACSFLRGVFAEAIDAGSDRGLRHLVERAGLDWQQALVWMADESWRDVAEDNRHTMFADHLWGVPSFRFGDLATWGQDRLWLVEQAIIETLGGPKATASDLRTETET
ncbi:DsbA family protein [Brevundimonas sp.]|uniref:DsbA family protein n=1 Tax=Brevundimonas sp. TaxID=1871086 RepID=UPI0035664E3A